MHTTLGFYKEAYLHISYVAEHLGEQLVYGLDCPAYHIHQTSMLHVHLPVKLQATAHCYTAGEEAYDQQSISIITIFKIYHVIDFLVTYFYKIQN